MLKSLPMEVPEMDVLDFTTLMSIAEMAAGMSQEEILATFSIDRDKFSADEEIYFVEFYNYGKGTAISKVVNNLIQSSQGKSGVPAAMAYLRRFAKEFEKEVEGDSAGNFSFSFGKDETK